MKLNDLTSLQVPKNSKSVIAPENQNLMWSIIILFWRNKVFHSLWKNLAVILPVSCLAFIWRSSEGVCRSKLSHVQYAKVPGCTTWMIQTESLIKNPWSSPFMMRQFSLKLFSLIWFENFNFACFSFESVQEILYFRWCYKLPVVPKCYFQFFPNHDKTNLSM